MELSSSQRAYLRSLAMTLETILQIGKGSITPEYVKAADEALEKRELIKVGVLKNCPDDVRMIAETLSERTGSTLVHVIGKKIVLYRPKKKNPVIKLP
ncbi:MAG: ribosome assembly RNA-binding protein YhbY [Lachnospiraceae bacterium]|nr:ribosome assembly RNA-binding protein YhbY [Lachnospiraceae bacterium]